MKLIRQLAALLALALLSTSPSFAQAGRVLHQVPPGQELPTVGIYCDDGTGHAGNCITQGAVAGATSLSFGTTYDYSKFGTIRVQVDALSGGDSITFSGSISPSGISYPMTQIVNAGTGTSVTSITSNGVYVILFVGGLFLTPIHVGTASTPIIRASASQ